MNKQITMNRGKATTIDSILVKIHGISDVFTGYMLFFIVGIALFPYVVFLNFAVPTFYTFLVIANLFLVLTLLYSWNRNSIKEKCGLAMSAACLIFFSWIFCTVTSEVHNVITRNLLVFINDYGVLCSLVILWITWGLSVQVRARERSTAPNNRRQIRNLAANTTSADFNFLIFCFAILLNNIFLSIYISSFLFHPANDTVIQVLNSSETIEHHFFNIEGIKTEADGKLSFVEGYVINRSNPALYTWYSKNGIAGHVALQLAVDNTYLSHWPDNGEPIVDTGILEKETFRGVQSDVKNDIEQERGLPDHVIIFKPLANLREEKILEWNRRNIETGTSYHYFVDNCISYINKALIVGEVIKSQMLPFELIPIYKVNPSTSYFTENVIREFQSSGRGWLDWLFLVHANVVNVIALGYCLILVWFVIEKSFCCNANQPFIDGKLNFLKKLKFW